MAEHGETALGVANQRDIQSWVHEVILAVEFGQPRGRLGEGEARKMNGAEQRQAHVSLAIEAAVGAQVLLAEDFDRDLIIGAEGVASGRANSAGLRRGANGGSVL